jgi:hypothetical protein
MIRQLRLAQVKKVLEKGNVDSGLLKEMDALMGVVVLLARSSLNCLSPYPSVPKITMTTFQSERRTATFGTK